MVTQCYAMVRGSVIRVTDLGVRGDITSPVRYAVSKSVAKVAVNEVAESGNNEVLRTEEDEPRIKFTRPDQTIRFITDIDFLRVDPGVLSLVTGVPLTNKASLGFGEGPFGAGPFGGVLGGVTGFDSVVRLPPKAFALEVWTKLAGLPCMDPTTIPPQPMPRQWGYTVFPYLRGGWLSGFSFSNGLVSFNLRGAQTRRGPRWGVGPHDLEGSHQRLLQSLGRNVSFRSFATFAQPPVQADGITEFDDVIHGGSASMTSSDVIEGGSAATTSPWIVEGGRAV